MAAMAIRCFLCTIMAVFAIRSKAPEEALNLDDFAPLCDEDIVNDTCRLLNEGDKHLAIEQFTTWQEIAEHLSAEPGSLEKFKEKIGYWGYAARDGTEWIECKPLCETIVELIKKVAVLPPKSDIVCYTPMDETETVCDLDVRPSVLKTLGPKRDADLPDFGDASFLKTSAVAKEQVAVEVATDPGMPMDSEQVGVEVATEPGMPMDSDTPLAAGVNYTIQEALERLANLFRIYPDLKSADLEDGGSSLMQRSFESRMRGMTPDQARLVMQKEEMAKAYMGLVIRAFSAKETQDQMKKWFGRDSFSNPMARKEVLRVMNSVDHMINNVRYVYPGPVCPSNEKLIAYVYPYGGVCNETELGNFTCKIFSDAKRERERSFTFSPTDIPTRQFVFYLCPNYFIRPWEMVETLVHEGSHHATAYTDDVVFQGKKTYGRHACQELAGKEPLLALKNADNFGYYIQDVADAVHDHPGQVSAMCPTMAKFKQADRSGDCQCPNATLCHWGGRMGCPYSATPRRSVHNVYFFNAECIGCSCEGPGAVTTTDMWSWDGSNFGWDSTATSEPESEAEGTLKCPEHSALPIADSNGDCYCSGASSLWQDKAGASASCGTRRAASIRERTAS